MKLSSRTNLGLVTLLFLAFTALSVAELRELQAHTSRAVTLQAEKSAEILNDSFNQVSAPPLQTEQLILNALLESAVSQPYISAAALIDADGNEIAQQVRPFKSTVPSWFSLIDPSANYSKRVSNRS